MKVVILGAGAVGTYYGGMLARGGHDVTCFARGANLAAIRERGIEIRTPEERFAVPVQATDRPDELEPAHVALLAIKSYSLRELAPVIRRCAEQRATILPLLNGVETVERLEQQGVPGAAIIGGLTKVSAVRLLPGVVERRSAFQIVIAGELDGRKSDRVDAIVAALRESGVDARATDRIGVELWEKFIFIVTMAAACGLTRSPIGPLRDDPLGRRLLQRAADEVVAVARARHAGLNPDAAGQVMTAIDALPAGMKPSFLLDLESGGPTELEILSGTVSRFADEAGIPVPIHDTVAAALARRR